MSVDNKSNFEIVPNTLKADSMHVPSVEFNKFPERKVVQPLSICSLKRRTFTGEFNHKITKFGKLSI